MKFTCPDCQKAATATIVDAGTAPERHRYIVDVTHDDGQAAGKNCGAGVLGLVFSQTPVPAAAPAAPAPAAPAPAAGAGA